MRMPDAQKFDLDKIASVTATPWSIHETAQQEGVFAEKEVKPQQEQADSAPKKLYISQADLDAHGYTPGCKKCASILAYGQGKTTTPHSVACRARIEQQLSESDAGKLRL